MFLEKYHDFFEDYNNPINRILTVVLLITSLVSLYLTYVRFDNYDIIYKTCLMGYLLVILAYGWSFTGKSHQSFLYLYKNDISEFLLRALFLIIIFINAIYDSIYQVALLCVWFIVMELSVAKKDNSMVYRCKKDNKVVLFFEIVIVAVWFAIYFS